MQKDRVSWTLSPSTIENVKRITEEMSQEAKTKISESAAANILLDEAIAARSQPPAQPVAPSTPVVDPMRPATLKFGNTQPAPKPSKDGKR